MASRPPARRRPTLSHRHRARAGTPRAATPRRGAAGAACDATAIPGRSTGTTAATPDRDTDHWLVEHGFDPSLDASAERGDETFRGTAGRGRLSVEARRTASALDDSPDRAITRTTHPPVVAIGGSASLHLHPLDLARAGDAGPASSSRSMRGMEVGLALVAFAVALLLNLGR